MQLSDRFVDYATTGAFFIVSQLILLVSWNPGGLQILFFWLTPASSMPAWLQTPADGLLAALGISSIFFFGLALDLLGAVLRSGELQRFHVQLLQNRDWLVNLAGKDPFVARGLVDFLQLDPTNVVKDDAKLLPLLNAWNDDTVWKIYRLDILKDAIPFTEQSSKYLKNKYVRYKSGYSRLRYYLNSFISFNNEGTALDAVSDQTRLWRTGRAIFVTTIALVGECLLALLAALSTQIFRWPVVPWSPSGGVLVYSIAFVVLVLALYIARRMALEPYSRMYANTLALAYLTYKKLDESPDANKDAPGKPGLKSRRQPKPFHYRKHNQADPTFLSR